MSSKYHILYVECSDEDKANFQRLALSDDLYAIELEYPQISTAILNEEQENALKLPLTSLQKNSFYHSQAWRTPLKIEMHKHQVSEFTKLNFGIKKDVDPLGDVQKRIIRKHKK